MIKRQIQALSLFFVAFLVILAVISTTGSSRIAQAFYYTPTPQPDGRILYIVKENDTCISIALLNGITEQELRSLNNLEGDDCLYLQPGRELLILEKQELTPTPEGIETPAEPTPTPFKGNGTICIYLFNDENGNAMAEENELPIAGGEVSVTDRLSTVNLIGTTDASGEPICFEDIPEGDYNISVAIPEGYNPTTTMNYALSLSAGEISVVDFGAQPSSSALPIFGEEKTSPWLAVLGLFFIGAGIGFWFYARKIV
jgi:LysM repeat protein